MRAECISTALLAIHLIGCLWICYASPPPALSNSTADVRLSDVDACIALIRAVNPPSSPRGAISHTVAGSIGFGYDMLLDVSTAPVFARRYTRCEVTPDGVALVPDGVTVELVHQSRVDSIARCYSNFEEWAREVGREFGAEAKLGWGNSTIGISYSQRYQQVKKSYHRYESVIFSTELVHHAYTNTLDGTAQLDAAFRARIDALDYSGAQPSRMGLVQSQLVVRDYGTHVATTVDMGASWKRVDMLEDSESMRSEETRDDMRAGAKAAFGETFSANVHGGRSVNETSMRKFHSSVRDSWYHGGGGPSMVQWTLSGNASQVSGLLNGPVMDQRTLSHS